MITTKDIVSKFADLPDAEREGLIADALQATADLKWLPLPGPQTTAYFSPADILLYGGEAGGSKTDSGLGLAFTVHRHSLLCRRQYTDLGAMITRALHINGTRQGFNGAPPAKLVTPDGRTLEFFAAHQVGDEQRRQGQPVDLLFIDEAAQFQWAQIQVLLGWLRSTDAAQRCRCVLASNPPLSSEGAWIVEEFAPWLDPGHPNPAKAGELRWYVSDEYGKSQEVDGPEEVEIDGRMVKPQSRTFIPAGLKDNPFLSRTAYKDRLDNLPLELRRAAKSTLARVLRRLIDPNTADTRTGPKDETDLLVAAKNGWVINLDNLSVISPWLADALCRLATGGGFGARQLYTNADEVVFEAKRPIIINGIPTLATRPDLGDRCLSAILPSILETEKWDEETFWETFEDRAGTILGGILDCVAHGLNTAPAVRDFCKENGVPLPRMADAAIWAGAALEAVGWPAAETIALLVQNQRDVQKHIADADLVVNAIHHFMESRTDWEGTTTDLLKQVCENLPDETKKAKDWPKSASAFSGRLRRAAPGLRMTGVDISERVRDGIVRWQLNKISRAKDPTYPTYATSKGDKGDEWDDFSIQSNGADPDDQCTYLDDSDYPLSPETREANRQLGKFPAQFDRRSS